MNKLTKGQIAITAAVLIYFTCFFTYLAWGHEEGDWYHINETTHIVASQDCFAGRLWFVTDPDNVGPVIECRFVRFVHGKQHALSFEPVDGTCYCWMGGE